MPPTSSSPSPSGDPAPSFSLVAPYYDELMRDVPYGLWTQFALGLAKRHHCQPQRILDLACGTGTVTLMLARQGYTTAGIDGSSAMLEVARRKALEEQLPVPFQQARLESFEAPGSFDLVLCLYDSLNNILDPNGLRSAFRCVADALRPGGLFIFDMNTEYALRANLFSQQNRNSDAVVQYDWKSHYDYATGICAITMDFWVPDGERRRHFREVHRQRAYRYSELDSYLQGAGLHRLAFYDGISLRPPHPRTDRAYCVAERSSP